MSKHKKLIICADGTWNTVDKLINGIPISTNVARLAAALSPHDKTGVRQMLHYHQGVGTEDEGQLAGGALGWGLTENIMRAYDFLIRHYEEGDEISLFGFSRGAFTVRSLAALIGYAGILQKDEMARCAEAMAIYKDRHQGAKPTDTRATVFRRMYSREARIKLLGVWDTVGSVGLPEWEWIAKGFGYQWGFHDTTLGSHVDNAVHAMAIHELRQKFPPTLWKKSPGSNVHLSQVWFTGAHADVGGGYEHGGLSDITLDWMIEQAEHLAGLAVEGELKKDSAQRTRDWQTKVASKSHNELKGFWKIFGSHKRGQDLSLGNTDTFQDIHESVLERYRPTLSQDKLTHTSDALPLPPEFQAAVKLLANRPKTSPSPSAARS